MREEDEGLRGEEGDDFSGAEPGVAEASEDLVDAIEGLWDEQVGRSLDRQRTT